MMCFPNHLNGRGCPTFNHTQTLPSKLLLSEWDGWLVPGRLGVAQFVVFFEVVCTSWTFLACSHGHWHVPWWPSIVCVAQSLPVPGSPVLRQVSYWKVVMTRMRCTHCAGSLLWSSHMHKIGASMGVKHVVHLKCLTLTLNGWDLAGQTHWHCCTRFVQLKERAFACRVSNCVQIESQTRPHL